MTSIEPTPFDDEEFTDIELADLDGSEPVPVAATEPPAGDPDAVPADSLDGQLGDARAVADRLREHSANLAQLDDAELHEHVAYYQQAHSELQRALGEIDNA